MGDAEARVDRRIEDGWLPSMSQERTWVRGAVVVTTDEDRTEDLSGAQMEPMTEDEEKALIHRTYNPHGTLNDG